MKLRGKLFSLVVILGLVSIAVMIVFSMMVNNTFSETKNLFYDELYICNSTMTNADRDFYQANSALLKSITLKGEAKDEDIEAFVKIYTEKMDASNKGVNDVISFVSEYPELYEYEVDGKSFKKEYQLYRGNLAELIKTYNVETGKGNLVTYEKFFESTRNNIANMESIMEGYAQKSEKELTDSIKRNIMLSAALSLIVIIVVIVLSIIIVNRIRNSIVRLTKGLTLVSQKDLTVPVKIAKGKDEVAQLSRAAYNLREQLIMMMETLKGSSATLYDASNKMAVNTNDSVSSMESIDEAAGELAKTASLQAGDVCGVVSEIDEITSITEDSINNTNDLAKACEEIERATQAGMEVVELLTQITEKSSNAFDSIFDAIEGIDDKARTIGTASDMITDIASQTNLLSLNASIEAARAGEAGKGFAVVAEEIRNLAVQSASSVQIINNMINELYKSSNNATEQSKLVKQYVDSQRESVEDTRRGFQEVVDNVSVVNSGVETLKGINELLGERVKYMTGLIDSLSAASEENAATAQELSATTTTVMTSIRDLQHTGYLVNESSGDLNSIVDEYKVDEEALSVSFASGNIIEEDDANDDTDNDNDNEDTVIEDCIIEENFIQDNMDDDSDNEEYVDKDECVEADIMSEDEDD